MMISKLFTAIMLVFLFSSCNSGSDYYITNNVLEAEIYNIQGEVGGRVILNNLERGKIFHRGDILAMIDTTIVNSERNVLLANLVALSQKENGLKARRNTLRSNVKYFQSQYQKWQELAKSDAGPQQRADDFKHQYNLARLQLAELETQIKAIPSERAALNAKLASIVEKFKKHWILSPIDGQVIDKFVQRGEVIGPGTPLAQMTDPQKMHVYLYWPIEFLNDFKIGEIVSLHTDGSEGEIEGKIVWVSPKSEFTPKIVQSKENRAQLVYQVRIEIENQQGKLKIGQPIEIRLPWKSDD